MSRRLTALAFLGLAPGLLGGCDGGEAQPRWISLADRYQPLPPLERQAALLDERAGARVREAGGALLLELDLPAAVWERAPGGGWSTEPRHELLALAQPERGTLHLGTTRLARAQERTPRRAPEEPVVLFENGRLTVFGPGTEEPPEQAVFSVELDDGVRADGTWWVVSGDLSGAGVPLWPGEEVVFELALPADSMLRFVPVLRSNPGDGPTLLTVRLDGETLAELEVAGDERPFVELALPARSRANARLSFVATGPPRITVLYRPVVGPSAIGRPGARPWSSGAEPAIRPDLVLFVADTLRADALAAWGGAPDVAPRLNRLAERSRRYASARAPATWTLPSVASLLTGVYPPEHGVERSDQGLRPSVLSIAELLRAHGYRTAAVTDSFFVSRRHGFQQGFEWFQEIHHGEWDLERTLAAAREQLDRDDGRPLFLLVHTYRVHKPYRAGTDELADAYEQLLAEVRAETGGDPRAAEAAFKARAPDLEAMYVEGARGLDAVAGPWLTDLVDSERLANGVLILTSDHGEAFGEHGELWHKGPLWDEVVRVPLFLHGPGVPAGVDPRNASLVDLVPTLAQMAGIRTPPGAAGSSLLDAPRDRPTFGFWTHGANQTESVVIVDGKKLMLSPRSELTGAYDLEQDPGEARDLAGDEGVDWPRALLERTLPELRRLFERRDAALDVPHGEDRHEAFSELGYADE